MGSPGRSRSKLRRREAVAFYLFISPWIVGFLLFWGGPIVASALLSFTSYDILTPPQWVGLQNYKDLLTGDPLFWQSLKVSAVYTLGAVPLGIAAGLGLALLLNLKIPGMRLWRTVYYLPAVVSGVAVALLWQWIFNPTYGILNYLLWKFFKIQGPMWVFDEKWVLPSFILMSLWGVGGSMVIYLSGLQSIPTELYEAAQIDGAGRWAQFRHITLPMISPVIFFQLVIGIINSFQVFTPAFVMTRGGPGNASLFYVLYLYQNAFQYFKMGYASAQAWLFFLLMAVLTAILFKTSNRWVYYAGEGGGR